jgi:Glycosyltransferase 61
LAGAGFEKVVLELLPFDEQVALFRRAECVIGGHGAGLSNIIFSPPGCRIVEIRNMTFDQNANFQARGGNIFWRLSQFLDFDYRAFFSTPDDSAYQPPEGAIVESARLPNLKLDIKAFLDFYEYS